MRLNLKSPLINVAIKLFQHSATYLTDAGATEIDLLDDPNAAFQQEVSIMSALNGHPSIATLIGYVEGAASSIIMKLYKGSLNGLIE